MKKLSIKERTVRLAKKRFLNEGFHKVSMDSLVEDLRTSKSSVYNHFSSKHELVKIVLEQLNAEIDSTLHNIIEDDKLSFKGKLVAISEYTKDLLSSVSDVFLKDLQMKTPDLWDYYQELRARRINQYYRALFKTGIRENLIRTDIDIEIILIIYLNLTEIPLKQEYLRLLNIENENIYEDATEVFLNGILIE